MFKKNYKKDFQITKSFWLSEHNTKLSEKSKNSNQKLGNLIKLLTKRIINIKLNW